MEVVLESVNEEYIYLKLAGIYKKLNDKEMTVFTLQRGIKGIPDSYVLKGALADVYRADIENSQEAIKLYEQAYELSGEDKYAIGEAVTHAALKDYNSAIKIFDKLIEQNPKSDYYTSRARYYDKLGLDKESLDDYKKAVEIDGNFIAAAKLADHYVATGENELAIKYLKVVLVESPTLTVAKFRLAELLRKIGKEEEAESYYTEILEFLNEKEKVYVFKQLAAISYSNKEFDKAEEYFQKSYEIDQDIKTAYSIALLADNTGDIEQAENWYRIVLDKRPDFVEASKRLSILYLRQKNYDESLAVLEGVEDIYQDVDFYRIKAQAYTNKGDLQSAITLLESALKENPNEERMYLDLALVYDKSKDKEKAISTIKKGMEIFPDSSSFQNFLGYMYVEQGIRLDEAEELISTALKEKPDEPAYLDSMAWLYYQRGHYEKALPLQKRAVKGAPKEQEIIEHMKAILEKLGINKSIDEILQEK